MSPTVSVIIPTFNCAAYLLEAIQSVRDQSYAAQEIIVVDDGSTDDTASRLATVTDVVYLRQSNAGVASARNTGLRAATGECVAFLDADDRWAPDKLQTQVMALDAFPAVDLVCSDFSMIDEHGVTREQRYAKRKYRVFHAYGLDWPDMFPSRSTLPGDSEAWHGQAFRALFLGNFINTSSVLIRRRAIQRVGMFTAGRKTQEDYEYWLKLALGGDLAYIDRPLLAFRRRPNQLTVLTKRGPLARDVLDVVLQASDSARAVMPAGLVARRLSERFQAAGVASLGDGEAVAARRLLYQAVRHRPLNLTAAALYPWSWLPLGLAHGLLTVLAPFRR